MNKHYSITTHSTVYRCFLVDCVKGLAVFLDQTKALEYVGKYGGIIITMSGQQVGHVNVQETPNHSPSLRQEGQTSEPRAEFVHENPSCTSESSTSSGAAGQNIPSCGDSCPSTAEGLEQSLQACNDTVQCTGSAC